MQEFRIEDDSPRRTRQAKVRLLSGGAILLPVAIAIILFTTSRSSVAKGDIPRLGELAFALCILATIVAGNIVAFREALDYVARKMVFAMNSDGISRKS